MPIAIRAMISPRTTPMKIRFAVQMWGTSSEASIAALPAFGPEEDGPGQVVAGEQVCRGALELDLTLLEEDGTVRDRERDVERLLHDDHRLASRPQLVHQLEHPLHDDRRETERQLVDDEDLGLVQQDPGQCEHLLLAARQVAGQLVLALLELREQLEERQK